ncbi:MAG: hypothetical protein A4E57_00478 [Syntrophorhabdaceae bacterium PtaU1.Bin034]|nr:MAG: hypothetical protein A4E57_00478 [Syntrophorhabdaceae bacterium PtaU1.Bin034]
MQKGNGYGFNAGYFTDSDPLGSQYNTGSGWIYESASSDLQFYFTLGTPPPACNLSITPDTGLISTGYVGGPFSPSSQSYTLQNSGTLSCDWTAAKQQNWVSLSGTSGSLAPGASTTVTVSINSSANSLGAGSYSDSVNFNWNTGSTTRSVGLTVIPLPAGLTVTPSSGLASSGYTGGPFSPSSISYTLRNTGSTSINWTAAKGQNWVSLSPTNGTLTAGASRTVTASINSSANSLGAGSYSDTVTFTNTTNHIGDTTRPVSLTVTPAPCPLSINPSSLGFSGYQGGPFTPASLTYTLTTSGCTTSWNTSGVPSWATLSPPSGSVTGSTTVTVSINSNANTLSPNTYPAAITFNNVGDPGGGTSASVNLTVNPPPLPDLRVTPAAGFDSSGVKGGPFSPPSTSYTLQNMGAGSLNWTAAKGQGWVDLSPTSGSLAAGASTTVTVSINANANNLAAGSHSDTITFTGGTGSITRSVNLSVRKDVYGGGINADSLDSVAIGKYGTDWPVVSYRFRAPHMGTIDSFAVYHSIGTGNAEGTGGVIVMEVRADEVSGDHVPSSTRLASAVNQSPISNGQVYTYVLDTPLSVTEGTIYHLVFTNTHPDPTNNWCSLHTIWNVSDTENMQPRFSDVDFACLLQYGAENPWEVRYSSTPVYNAHYTDGRMWGVGYIDVPISSMTRTVSGSSQVRQRFAVTGGDWVVSGISARVNGSGTLHFSLETGNGTLIEEGNVAGVSTGGAMQWVTYNLTTNRQLLNGQAYHLVLSAPSGSFTTFPMQKGDAYGLPAGDFPGGYFEYTGGSGWETSRTDTDLQSYFTVESHSPLAVTPATFTVTGYEGGPFNPSSQGYAVQNTTASQITWSASKTRNWVDLSPTGGTLAAGASTNVTVAINANANGLAAGDYGDTVTFTAGTISTTRPVSLAVRKDTYGSGLNADGTDSVAIGRYGADMPVVSYRFRAPHTGTIDKFLVYHNTDGGAGDGGIITMAVRNDDGSTDHLPSSGPPLATAVNQYARSNDSPYWYNLSTPIQVTAGRIYHLVFRNTHPNPATNWCSLVVLWNASETPGMQPRFSDLDFASLVQWGESNPLAVRYAGTPIYNAHYTNGTMWGVGYVNALISSMTKSISGANRVRERFTVAGGARVVSAVSARVNGSGTLTFRLERADGTLVEQGNVSGISTGGNMQWVTYNLTQNRTLSNGQAYRLILSASSGSFTTFPMQKGDAYGLTEGNFADGYFEYTNGSGWGTSRTDTDLQFYFAVE